MPSTKVLECCAAVKELAKCLSAVQSESETVERKEVLTCIWKFNDHLTPETIKSSEFAAAVKGSKLLTLMVDTLICIQNEGQLSEGDGATFSGSLTVAMLNMTNHSVEVCREVSNIENFFRVFFINLLSSNDADNLGSNDNIFNRIYHTIGIVFNCYFKNDSEIFARLSDYELVDSTKPYLKCRHTNLSTVALVLIAFAVDEKKADIFQGARQNISFLIGTLKGALASEKRTCNGYDAVEAAKCIRRLALNDSNKDLLIELSLLPVVKQMLASSRDDDVTEGIEILFTLSFSKKSVAKIRSEFQEILDKLQSNAKWRDNQQLQGLLFQLKEPSARPASAVGKAPVSGANKKGSTESPAAPVKKSHKVMISYNHASKPVVERLYKKLVDAKIEVWVDFKDMKSGSVYQAMANGVESSIIVLVCMTRLYNESNNCRLECEYAHECNKKLIPLLMEAKFRPEGWLGLLTRAELRYDLTETKYPFEEKAQELLTALVAHLDGAAGSRVSSAVGGERRGHALPTAGPLLPPIQAVTAAPKLQAQPGAPPEVSRNLRSWDKAAVEAWCRDNKLPEAVKKRGLTGVELQFLVNTLARSPEYFGRVMETHMGFKGLLDLATFVAALEDLMVAK